MTKDIKLKELTLENFKGQNRHVSFGDSENRISGRNASGKSTLMKAWNWLLSGYSDAATNPNADLFDNTQKITPNTPIASVEAVVSIDGEVYKVKRTAEAKFTRKRGTDTYEKANSDEYRFYIDDIERNATAFREWLGEHFTSDDMMRFVLDGQYFIAQVFDDKKKARSIIEKVVGTITREEMKGNYSDIDDLLQKYTLDEIEERCKNLIKGIDQRLTEIPSLIQSKETEISEIEQTDFAAIEKNITSLETERAALDKRMTDLSERVKPQMEAKHAAEREKQMKQDVYDKAYSDWKSAFNKKRDELTSEINAIRKQNDKSKDAHSDAVARRNAAVSKRTMLVDLLDKAQQKRLRLLAERDAEKARAFDTESAKCPFCGHQLDGDKLQEEINKFEAKKREVIDNIVIQGKATAAEIKNLEEQIKQQIAVIDTPLPEVMSQSTEELEKRATELANADTSRLAFTQTEQGKQLFADIAAVVIPEVVMPDNREIMAAKQEVNSKLTPLYERRGLKSRLQSLKDSIEVLRVEQKEKGAEMAKYERQRQLVRDYKQEQTEILSHKVNDGLKFSRIDVWSQQKDGTVVPDLVLRNADGVSYATANGASRITTALDIQRFFCERLGVNMPSWVDEMSILDSSNMPHLDGVQMFYLFCSETSLNVESI